MEAGVDPDFDVYVGNDPLGFVVSKNLHRRHLSESQRAMAAARIATLKQGARTDLSPIGEMSQADAAAMLNVGKRSVERARIVHNEGGPELVHAVEAGEVSVSAAVEKIKRGINTGVAMNPYAERGLDLYQTPPAAVRALLDVYPLPPSAIIWEPACGPGNIVRTLRAAGHKVVATDIERYDCPDSRGGVDFLKPESAPDGARIIVTNPPFMHADAFVRHALRLAPRVVMLLRLAFIESIGRSDILDGGKLARVFVFANRLSQIHRDGWDGPRTSNPLCLAWFVWDRKHRGPIELHRISWRGDGETAADLAVA